MAVKPRTTFEDGFSDFTAGMNSGVKPILLPKNQLSYATNCTVRGRYVTHRPPYQIQRLVLDAGVDLGKLRFQGATYYKPDFGQESMIASIGGRLFQFIPDMDSSLFVFDRTVKNYVSGISFVTQKQNVGIQYELVLLNLNDTSAATYPAGTPIFTNPYFISLTSVTASLVPHVDGANTILQGRLPLPADFDETEAENLVGRTIHVDINGQNANIAWSVIGHGDENGFPFITVSHNFGTAVGINPIAVPAGTPLFLINNVPAAQNVAVTSVQFVAPPVGNTRSIFILNPFAGSVGDVITLPNGSYMVSNIIAPVPASQIISGETVNTLQSTSFAYDPNSASVLQSWLWQSENYIIIQNGQDRPIFFDGNSSRRALTATFNGKLAQSFLVPPVGTPVTLTLDGPFRDAIGTYLNFTPVGQFPFLMRATSINVGGNPNVITAVNITGLTQTNSTLPIGAPVNSAGSPDYAGVTTSTLAGGDDIRMPAPGEDVTFSVAPPFNGVVDDTILLTDGTGPLTAYQLKVSAIGGGGSQITATNINAPTGLIINIGYPVISAANQADELPVGRMGAYVQGRNWISSPDGKYFIAGDQVGSASGSPAKFDRDAVLKWSQNTTKFTIPGGAGKINCIIALSALDASLGQGPLQILCDNDIFNCSAPTDATQWASVTTPILSESAIGFGGVGQNAAVVSNGDLILKSNDATIHSLKLARQDFNQWGNLPISQEVNRVIEQENLNLLNFITANICNNRCIVSCAPITGANGVYSQGMIAIDFDVTSSLQGKLPSVYDGVWKDLNVQQIITGKFNKVDRTFVFALNNTSGAVEVWEILPDGYYDNGDKPITWSFESPVLFGNVKGKGELDLVRLEDGAIWISNLVGSATIKVWWRPDYDDCWHFWRELTICADNLPSGPKQQRLRVGLGMPDVSGCDESIDKSPDVGRFFQTRFEITGSLDFMASLFLTTVEPESRLSVFEQNEGPTA